MVGCRGEVSGGGTGQSGNGRCGVGVAGVAGASVGGEGGLAEPWLGDGRLLAATPADGGEREQREGKEKQSAAHGEGDKQHRCQSLGFNRVAPNRVGGGERVGCRAL